MANKEAIAALLEILLKDEPAEVAEQEPQQKTVAEPPVQEPQPEEPEAPEEKHDDEAEALRKKLEEQANKTVASTLASKLTGNGIDGESVQGLLDYLSVEALKKDGEADEEAIENLSAIINSIALRKPPTSGAKRKSTIMDASASGLGQYLKEN